MAHITVAAQNGGCAQIYEKTLFEGLTTVLCGNHSDLRTWNDRVFVLLVGEDYVVKLQSEVNYQGSSSFEFTGTGHIPDFYYGALATEQKEMCSKEPFCVFYLLLMRCDAFCLSSEIKLFSTI